MEETIELLLTACEKYRNNLAELMTKYVGADVEADYLISKEEKEARERLSSASE